MLTALIPSKQELELSLKFGVALYLYIAAGIGQWAEEKADKLMEEALGPEMEAAIERRARAIMSL